jgi:hypothetical protein
VNERNFMKLVALFVVIAAPVSVFAGSNVQSASDLPSNRSPAFVGQGGPYCIQNTLLASNGAASFLSDNGTFWQACLAGEKWTFSLQGGSYCIQNNLLASNGSASFLSDNGTFWQDCSAGEKWTLTAPEYGVYCIQNNLLASNGGASFLSDNGTFWQDCSAGEKWTIFSSP